MSPASQAPERSTAIFAKRPQPGAVKTRLCPPLSPEAASELALAMLDDAVARLSERPEHALELAFSPPEERPWFEERYGERLVLRPQVGSGLGERLANHFEEVLGGPVQSAVVVGSDAPFVESALVQEAHEALLCEDVDLVLGPDCGGGYYLVGLRAPRRSLFELEMSTGDMCRRTIEHARSVGLEVRLLQLRYDVDVEADLRRLTQDLRTVPPRELGAEFPHHTRDALSRLSLATP